MHDLPSLSVIIPVYNDTERLGRCLDCIARQTYPARRMQVLVIDNGSTEDLAATVARHLPSATLLHELRPGSYAARNRGLVEAHGEILAFTDSDCLPEVDWLSTGVAELQQDPSLGLVAGRIVLFPYEANRPTGAELYDLQFGLAQKTTLERDHYGLTANLFTRRTVVDQVGPFDPSLRSNGDREWGTRVWAAGYPMRYAESSVVRHPARRSLRELARKARRVVGGRIDIGLLPMSLLRRVRRWLRLALPPRGIGSQSAAVRGTYGRGAAVRFYWTVYAIRLTSLAEELRLALGGTSRR